MRSKRRGYYLKILAFLVVFSLGAGRALAQDESGMIAGALCDTSIQQVNSNAIQAALAGSGNFWNNGLTPPAMLGQVANTPCMSNELQRINNQFGGMVRSGVSGIGAATGFLRGGPVSAIMNSAFKGDFQTFNSAASLIPQMLNFQSMASNALGGLLDQLGLSGTFSSQMCGLMLDMVLKYIQCENPIKFPNLSNLFGKLDLNLPGGCTGQALRSTMYGLARTDAVKNLSQTMSGW